MSTAALVLAGTACGDGTQVRAGDASDEDGDAATLVKRGLAGALAADTYRVRVSTIVGEPTDASTDPHCGLGDPTDTREIAVGDGGHRAALIDPRSGAVRSLRDDREPLVYVATATLPGPADTPTPWTSIDTSDPATAGLAALLPSLYHDLLTTSAPTTDRSLLTLVQRSAADVTTVDRREVDGATVSYQHITVDRRRFEAAERDLADTEAHPMTTPGIPPATITTPAPGGPLPTFETWIDDTATLRRVVANGLVPTRSEPLPIRLELTYEAFGEPFPAATPTPDEVTDFGSLPASVLLPHPDCAIPDVPPAPPGAETPSALIDTLTEYSRCIAESQQQAAAGQTVSQWLEHSGNPALDTACELPGIFPR